MFVLCGPTITRVNFAYIRCIQVQTEDMTSTWIQRNYYNRFRVLTQLAVAAISKKKKSLHLPRLPLPFWAAELRDATSVYFSTSGTPQAGGG